MTTTPSSGSSGETPEQGSGSTSRYEAAVEQLHQTATWLIGIFAGIAALLIAGTQLSTIGHLRPDDIHLWLALAAGLLSNGHAVPNDPCSALIPEFVDVRIMLTVQHNEHGFRIRGAF